jgi:hypothetical protein
MVNLFLKNKVNNSSLKSKLFISESRNGYDSIVKQLLDLNAYIQIKGKKGITALICGN